jgi:hypothetical protein
LDPKSDHEFKTQLFHVFFQENPGMFDLLWFTVCNII